MTNYEPCTCGHRHRRMPSGNVAAHCVNCECSAFEQGVTKPMRTTQPICPTCGHRHLVETIHHAKRDYEKGRHRRTKPSHICASCECMAAVPA